MKGKRRSDIYTDVHTHTQTMEYYSAIEKNEILPFGTTCLDLEGIMLSEISQLFQISYNFTYMWNLKKTKQNK